MTPNKPNNKVEEILFWCSRCGGKYKPLGRVLKWGKHYPAFTVKKADGTKEERPADTEIKEALCRDCAKEHYDNEKIKERTSSYEQGVRDGEEKAYKNVGSWYHLPEYKDFKGGCNVCGGEPVEIRGKHPHEPKRLICPVCTREVLESILDSCNGREASQEKALKNN